jgi:hypothetical protein
MTRGGRGRREEEGVGSAREAVECNYRVAHDFHGEVSAQAPGQAVDDRRTADSKRRSRREQGRH